MTEGRTSNSAIVMGGSIAGLLAARVLSNHFERVIHLLLPGGLAVIDRLFTGASEELIRNGAQPFDYGQS